MRSALLSSLACGLLFLAGGLHAAPAPPEKWGTIKGQIVWKGKVPAGGPEEFVINNTNKGLKNVFVWLIDASDPTAALPINPALKSAKEVTLSIQAGPPRRFEPHVFALQATQKIVVKNPTVVADAIDCAGEDGNIRAGLAPGKSWSFSREASRKPYRVTSPLFPNMRCWVRVFDHPYFAVTDGDGKFEIKGAPPGKFNIVIWHEGIGWTNGGKNGKPITITAGKTVEVNETVKADE